MLMTEWNMEDALEVRYEEGRDEGREEGREEGRDENRMEIARNLLSVGSTCEFVSKITGLDIDTVMDINAER
jgi:predicted transposase/invertase (TIGR01784 family)